MAVIIQLKFFGSVIIMFSNNLEKITQRDDIYTNTLVVIGKMYNRVLELVTPDNSDIFILSQTDIVCQLIVCHNLVVEQNKKIIQIYLFIFMHYTQTIFFNTLLA